MVHLNVPQNLAAREIIFVNCLKLGLKNGIQQFTSKQYTPRQTGFGISRQD